MKKRRKSNSSAAAELHSTLPEGVRAQLIDEKGQRWQWVIDNRMRNYGEINYHRCIIRINYAMHKRERESLIDTLFHEELHRLFPSLGERAICDMTKTLLPTLSPRYRAWLYSRIRKR